LNSFSTRVKFVQQTLISLINFLEDSYTLTNITKVLREPHYQQVSLFNFTVVGSEHVIRDIPVLYNAYSQPFPTCGPMSRDGLRERGALGHLSFGVSKHMGPIWAFVWKGWKYAPPVCSAHLKNLSFVLATLVLHLP